MIKLSNKASIICTLIHIQMDLLFAMMIFCISICILNELINMGLDSGEDIVFISFIFTIVYHLPKHLIHCWYYNRVLRYGIPKNIIITDVEERFHLLYLNGRGSAVVEFSFYIENEFNDVYSYRTVIKNNVSECILANFQDREIVAYFLKNKVVIDEKMAGISSIYVK